MQTFFSSPPGNTFTLRAKITAATLLLNLASLGLFAQVPLVYSSENTGANCATPPLPSFSQLPVVEPLPDPFMRSNGQSRSTSFSDWECRRNEIKAEIENYEIGTKPTRPQNITASYANGELTVKVTENGQTLTLTSQIVLPSGPGPFPAVIGMNSPTGSMPASIFTSRNVATIRFNHDQVTRYGNPQLTDPYYKLYPNQNLENSGQYSAWAWGVSRIIDGLELVQAQLPIDLKHLAVTGCSYAGKMALFSGAFDERIALTIAQESGGGGAPAWRVSETIGAVEKLGATDYRWFKDDMKQFENTNVAKLPHDHHELMAMIAPRALLVTGNTDFEWLANPSAYVSARAAHEVWKTFGIGDRFGFYIDGAHNHCAVPTTQVPAVEAFVEKFLLGNANANTNVTVHPYPLVDYQRWYKWWGTGNPVLPPLPLEPLGKRTWLEAECATVGSSWDVLTDATASKGAYVRAKSGLSSPTAAPTGAGSQLVLPFTIDSAGTYNFRARLDIPATEDYSYWLKIDNGPFEMISNQLARNPGFESGLTGWSTLNSSGATITANPVAADAHSGSGSMKVVNPTAQPGNQWRVQVSSSAFPTTIGKQYVISYWVRAAAPGGSIRLSTGPSSAQYQANQTIGTAWQQVSWTITASLASTTFLFDMGQVANTYYIDDVSVKEVGVDGWRWVKVKDAALSVGAHTLTIGYGTGNAKLDKLLITSYSGAITDLGSGGINCGQAPVLTPGQAFAVSETAAVGSAIGTVQATDADAGTVLQNWQITGGTGAGIVAINPATGQLTVVNSSALDFESATRSYTLVLTVTDGYFTSAPETVTINLTNANDNAPVVTPGLQLALDGGSCNMLGQVTASDADDTHAPGFTTFQQWQIVEGTGAGLFAINSSTGMLSIANLQHADLKASSYTVAVTVSDGLTTSAPQVVTVAIPDKITICHKGQLLSASKMAAIGHLQHGDCLGACTTTSTTRQSDAYLAQATVTGALEVYPNPAKDKINVDLGANQFNVKSIELVDVTGRTLSRVDVSKQTTLSIPIERIKPGVYMIRFNGDQAKTQRIVIQ